MSLRLKCASRDLKNAQAQIASENARAIKAEKRARELRKHCDNLEVAHRRCKASLHAHQQIIQGLRHVATSLRDVGKAMNGIQRDVSVGFKSLEAADDDAEAPLPGATVPRSTDANANASDVEMEDDGLLRNDDVDDDDMDDDDMDDDDMDDDDVDDGDDARPVPARGPPKAKKNIKFVQSLIDSCKDRWSKDELLRGWKRINRGSNGFRNFFRANHGTYAARRVVVDEHGGRSVEFVETLVDAGDDMFRLNQEWVRLKSDKLGVVA